MYKEEQKGEPNLPAMCGMKKKGQNITNSEFDNM